MFCNGSVFTGYPWNPLIKNKKCQWLNQVLAAVCSIQTLLQLPPESKAGKPAEHPTAMQQ